ncbi:hypothetical protein LJC20_00555 [Eubacteriales bacterium OttesenSCG-928-M02]|nr:hypothetical protein [Eubacteriales bacterium OttesenSCG-928-M02]
METTCIQAVICEILSQTGNIVYHHILEGALPMKKRVAIMLCLALLLSIVPVLALPETASAAPGTPAPLAAITIKGGPAVATGGDGYTYNAGTGTLTLTSFKDTTNPITWNDGYLNIEVNGDCEVPYLGGTNANCGILTISGTGTLTVSNPNGDAINLVNDLVVDGATLIAETTYTGGAGACAVYTHPGSITVKNSGTLTTSSTDGASIYINGGNLNVESNGSVVGTDVNNIGHGVYVAGELLGADYGNITVDGGSVKGEGMAGIRSDKGNITLISGSITGVAKGFVPGIFASHLNGLGGKITVKGGTLTGTSTYTTSEEYANGIRAGYGMEITGGVVLGENENPGAAAVYVLGAQLTMSGGKLTGTNTSIGGNGANGIYSDEGITMTGNASNTPEMIGSGAYYGIITVSNDITLIKATIIGTGDKGPGVYCRNLIVADSNVNAASTSDNALVCANELEVSGTSFINAKGAYSGINVRNSFKVRGNAYVSAEATGKPVGGQVIESYGKGIAMGGANSFDVDLASGMIIAKGVKGIWKQGGIEYNTGAGIQFSGNATVSLGKNTFVEDGQTLVDGDPATDNFKQAYGKNGVVAEETVLYYKADDVILSGLPTSVRVDVPFTLTPSITGGTWYFEEEYFSRDGDTFTPLKTGATVITYMLQDERTARLEVGILAREENPQTGDVANVRLWIWLMLGVLAITAGAWRKKSQA